MQQSIGDSLQKIKSLDMIIGEKDINPGPRITLRV